MSYLVFARKYRPRTFAEVLGQGHVARTLANALEGGRLAHAYLFCGPRGVGKTTMARILAKAVNCATSPGPEPCGDCDACRAIAAGHDVDVLEIDAASHRGVGDVEPLIDASRYLPQHAPKKVFIVDEAHMLSTHAWNALLKTLEEPPPHVLFIFATTEPHKVIETVRSRCQRFDFRRITPADIAAKLQRIAEAEGASVDGAVFDEIAARATGGMRDAETLFDQALSAAPPDRPLNAADLVTILGGIPRDVRAGLLQAAHAGDAPAALDAARDVVEAGADPVELLRDLYADLHDAAVAKARGDDAPFAVDWSLAAAEIVARHQGLARDSRAARGTLDLCLLALTRLGDIVDLEDLAARLEQAATGAAPAAAAPAPPSAPAAAPPKAKAKAPKVDLKAELARLKERQSRPKAELEPRAPAPSNGDAPAGGGAAPPAPSALSSDEMRTVRTHARVKEVLQAFRGQLEHVRRTDG